MMKKTENKTADSCSPAKDVKSDVLGIPTSKEAVLELIHSNPQTSLERV